MSRVPIFSKQGVYQMCVTSHDMNVCVRCVSVWHVSKTRICPGAQRRKVHRLLFIHSTLVAERDDKEFSVTGFFNLGSIKSISIKPKTITM